MLGMDSRDTKKAKIKDGTYIIDLDKKSIWQQPHTSVILSTSGTTKDISIDDLPDLPHSHTSRLYSQLQAIQKRADSSSAKKLSDEDVRRVRQHFFDFFCQMLKHFRKGVEETEWFRKGQ